MDKFTPRSLQSIDSLAGTLPCNWFLEHNIQSLSKLTTLHWVIHEHTQRPLPPIEEPVALPSVRNLRIGVSSPTYAIQWIRLLRFPNLETLGVTRIGLPYEGSDLVRALASFNNPLHITSISFVRLYLQVNHLDSVFLGLPALKSILLHHCTVEQSFFDAFILTETQEPTQITCPLLRAIVIRGGTFKVANLKRFMQLRGSLRGLGIFSPALRDISVRLDIPKDGMDDIQGLFELAVQYPNLITIEDC